MIRYLEDYEKMNIKPLYEQCFDDTDEYKNYYFEEVLPENHIAVYEENEKIVSMLHLIPKSVTIGKIKNHCFYIYGVATDESFRKKGIMRKVFDNVLNDLKSNGEYFTYLIPSSEKNGDIYKKFGFEYVMDKSILKNENIRKKPTHSLILRKADYSDLARLAIFAQSAMDGKYGIFLSKDREYFKNMFSLMEAENGKVELYFENKIVLGYRIGFDDEIIEEVLDESIQSMSWESGESKPYAMARILSIKNTLKLISTMETGYVVLKINDPVIEENNGTFLWRYDRNNVVWEKTDLTPQIELSIGEFTSHVFGYKEYDKLPRMNIKKGFFINDYV